MFEDAISLFDEYCRSFESERDKIPLDLASEAAERLKQLRLLIAKVEQLEREEDEAQRSLQMLLGRPQLTLKMDVENSSTNVPPSLAAVVDAHFAARIDHALEIRTMTEAFYYFASRLRDVLRSHLPHLGNFESPGVREVRHDLIEHPEKMSKVFRQSVAYGDAEGPRLKVGRGPDEPQGYIDKGLFVNALEFEKVLVEKLRNALTIRQREVGSRTASVASTSNEDPAAA